MASMVLRRVAERKRGGGGGGDNDGADDRDDGFSEKDAEEDDSEEIRNAAAVEKRRAQARRKAITNYAYRDYCGDPGNDAPENTRVLERQLGKMGVRVPRSVGTDDRAKDRAQRKAAACRVLADNGAEIVEDDDARNRKCLAGRPESEIAPVRLIRLRVGPDKSRTRCYDAAEIHRRILRSETFAAHFSPHQRARVAAQAAFGGGGGGGGGGGDEKTPTVDGATKSLPPCEAYSSFRAACSAAAPRCAYNMRTFIGDLLRRSSSLYADRECHPVKEYVRRLAAETCGDEKLDEEDGDDDDGSATAIRLAQLRAVLRDVLGRAIQQQHLPNATASDADEESQLSAILAAEKKGAADGKTARAPKIAKSSAKPAATTKFEASVAQGELELSIERLKRDLARRLALMSQRDLCRLLNANLDWYLDDTRTLAERFLVPIRALVGPYYEAASRSAEAFLQLTGFDYVSVALVRRLIGPALRLTRAATAQVEQALADRVFGAPEELEDEDAAVDRAERHLIRAASRDNGGGDSSSGGGGSTTNGSDDEASELVVRIVHLVVNTALAVYSNVFASYTAYFLLMPGGRALLDKIRRNPSLASVSGVLLAMLLDASADAGPIRLLQQLGLPAPVATAVERAVGLATFGTSYAGQAGGKLAGFVTSDLLQDAPKLAALRAALADTLGPSRSLSSSSASVAEPAANSTRSGSRRTSTRR